MALVSFGIGDRLAGWLVALGSGYQAYLRGTVLTNSSGTEMGTAGNPLITAGAGGSGMTQAEFIAALKSGTGTKTSVNSGTGSVTILASNANRKGASVTNTDANILYLDLSGGTATNASYTAAVASGAYYEIPFGYTGLITGIWAGDGSGAALVTEFT